jgi:hypothetical protein
MAYLDNILRWIAQPAQYPADGQANTQTYILRPGDPGETHLGPLGLADVQAIVHGYVEAVPIPGGAVMLVNADARIVQETFASNPLASRIAGQPIAGVAVVTNHPDWTGTDEGDE